MIVAIVLVVGAIAVYFLYRVMTVEYDYFKKMGLKNKEAQSTFMLVLSMPFSKKSLHDQNLELYNKFPDEKVVGFLDFGLNTFFIKDTDLLKQLAIKDFPHFQDHRTFVDPEYDNFFGNTLLAMKGKAWRDMRSTLSPLFTGSKMKVMLHLINHCANQFADFINEQCKETGKVNYKSKQLFSKYTNDVIASCAFGLECNSLKNTDNEFLEVGEEFLKFQRPWKIMKFILLRIAPRFCQMVGITLFSQKVRKMFNELIIQSMNMRRENGVQRSDMIQLLMSLKDGNFASLEEEGNKKLENERNQIKGEVKKSWTDDEIIAQSFIFFLAGFDTSSSAMQYIFYELSINQDVQQKLYEEVLETNEKLKGEQLTYEVMKDMKYMKMVINESLRKWPPLIAVDRACVKDYSYEDESGLKFTIKEGDILFIPIYCLHMDPKNFPNPEVFDPERFNDENSVNNNMDAFLPFGVGPRNCIGFRFALMEIKSLLYYLLLNFKINVGKDTDVPIKLKKSFFGLIPQKELQVEFVRRNHKKNI